MLINELIREYMKFNGYGASLNVFELESHLPKESADRELLMEELNMDVKSSIQVPLLYGMLFKPKN